MTDKLPWRVTANYHLWRIGLRPVLPGYYIQRVPILECHEPLVDLRDDDYKIDNRICGNQQARHSVAKALRTANMLLPPDMQLLVVEAFRSHERQKKIWELARQQTEIENPLSEAHEVNRLTGLKVADPSRESGNGHQTGGAVDLTLADNRGRELWMGTDIHEFTPATATRARVPREVRRRRFALNTAMTRAGFANYPAEWWHFSLGDRLWAAYSRKPYAWYGKVAAD